MNVARFQVVVRKPARGSGAPAKIWGMTGWGSKAHGTTRSLVSSVGLGLAQLFRDACLSCRVGESSAHRPSVPVWARVLAHVLALSVASISAAEPPESHLGALQASHAQPKNLVLPAPDSQPSERPRDRRHYAVLVGASNYASWSTVSGIRSRHGERIVTLHDLVGYVTSVLCTDHHTYSGVSSAFMATGRFGQDIPLAWTGRSVGPAPATSRPSSSE